MCESLLSLPKCVHGRNIYALNADGEFKDLLRHLAESSKDFGGLIFDGKPVYVPADKFADFPSTKYVFSMRLWLEIPEGVDLGVFKAIYEFYPTATTAQILPQSKFPMVEAHLLSKTFTRIYTISPYGCPSLQVCMRAEV